MRRWRLLRDALLNPERLPTLTLADWDRLLRLSRVSLLMGSLETRARAAGVLLELPEPVQAQLHAARVLAAANRRGVEWESSRLQKALNPHGLPVILLKGAAYAIAGLAAGEGRLFNDIDLLVPRERLDEVEQLLFWQGWAGTEHDAYDNRYYRQWMHELPPLTHQKRQSVLDVHHTILPPTGRYHPDPAKLRAAAVDVAGWPGVQILSPCDRVLHSACHLFHEGEWDHGLRDLLDLDALLREAARSESFWDELDARARELDLQRPLHYALRYCARIWLTPVPRSLFEALQGAAPGPFTQACMDWHIGTALAPMHPGATASGDVLARFGLYIRSHWLRMPMRLLLPHLLRKAFIKPENA